jgi:hypothetical protein
MRVSGPLAPYAGKGLAGDTAMIGVGAAAFQEQFIQGCWTSQMSGEIGIRTGGTGGMDGVSADWMHVPEFVLGVSGFGLTLTDTPQALLASLEVPGSLQYVRDMLANGRWGWSVTMYVLQATWLQDDSGVPVRQLREVLLVGASLVLNPAYPGAVAEIEVFGRGADKPPTVTRAQGIAVLRRMDEQSAREAAWLRVQAARELVGCDLRVGKVVSAATAAKLKAAIAHLQDLLNNGEPDADDGATGAAGRNPTDMLDGASVTGAPRPKTTGTKPDDGNPATGTYPPLSGSN